MDIREQIDGTAEALQEHVEHRAESLWGKRRGWIIGIAAAAISCLLLGAWLF